MRGISKNPLPPFCHPCLPDRQAGILFEPEHSFFSSEPMAGGISGI